MRRLDGKIAIVTGASSGLGEATARQLAEQGATVAVAAARRAERLTSMVERANRAAGQAEAIASVATRPASANVNEILITPTEYVR